MAFNDHRHEAFPTWLEPHNALRIAIRTLLSPNVIARCLAVVTTRIVPGVGSEASRARQKLCTTRFHSPDSNRYSRVRAAFRALGRGTAPGHTWGPSAAVEQERRRGSAPQAVLPQQRSHADVPSRTRQSAGAVSISPLPETAPAAAESRRYSRVGRAPADALQCQDSSSPSINSTLPPEGP
jgi:hypothetical protein